MKHIIDFDDLLTEVAAQARPHFGKGRTAHYIPELAQVAPNQFGMAVCMLKRNLTGRVLGDGFDEYGVGDCDTPFSSQSLTKLFALGLALNRRGDEVWMRVGKEPSGTPFNYLSQLEQEEGAPRNPFINAGALSVTDMLLDVVQKPDLLVRNFMGFLGAAELKIDEAVAVSELETAYKNRAIAHLMRSFGTINNDIDRVVESYCRQCAITINCRQLARAGLALAAGGFSPVVGESIFTLRRTRRLNALLLTCGIYDSVGSFAYRVGLPAKSGVGGGIIAIIPGQGAVAVWSPELDRFGTSVVGACALEAFANLTDCSVL